VARRRDHGGVTFIDLRDGSGVVQVVVRDEESVHDLRNEFCVKATGEVRPRPEGNANPDLATGEVEVVVETVEVLSEAAAAALPDRRAQELEHQRGGPAPLPLPGPAARGHGAQASAPAPRSPG
jgi:aspartyl-tRNA synthetase